MRYRVYLYSFDYCLQDIFETYQEAKDAGYRTGFEFEIVEW